MEFSNVFKFLTELAENNNRDWFNQHKKRYLAIKNEFDMYVGNLIRALNEIDPSIGHVDAKDCVFRIYRDVRFSLNKDPYKTHLGAYISKDGRKSQIAGYYVHVQPGQSFFAAGAYQPSSDVLKEIRYEILENTVEFKKIIEGKEFVKYFSKINGEKSKLAPKGFPKDFSDIDLLKFKSYEVIHSMDNDILLSKNIDDHLIEAVKVALPYNQFLNRAIQNALSEK
jgi:uncharacterized protein (TIGR02453 family)